MKRCIKIMVSGAIAGVGYLEFAQEYARRCKIEGTVQGQENGTVLIYAAGVGDALDEFIDFLYQGPAGSVVEEIALELAPCRDFRGVFRVIG